MQPIRELENILFTYSSEDHFLYTQKSLRPFFLEMSEEAYFKLLSRAVKTGLLERVCKGVYLYPKVKFPASKVLSYTAGALRGNRFNYVSLESVLSAESIISQQMFDWLTIVTNGRKGIINCGKYGTIEFVHMNRNDSDFVGHLHFDKWTGMLFADAELALKDMKQCRRPLLSMVEEN